MTLEKFFLICSSVGIIVGGIVTTLSILWDIGEPDEHP
jgi:hypothetical protein